MSDVRVASLLPSATEVAFALGIEPVAVSHECDHPPRAREKPTAIRARIGPDASSAEVNERVARAEREGGVYEVDLDVLREADPDLLLTQGVCEVCAVDDAVVREAVDRLDLDAEVLSTHPHSLEGVLSDIERIGEAAGVEGRAAALVADLRERVEAVERAAAGTESPRVAVLDWMEPVMVAGHWIPGMVGSAGGAYGMADPGERSRPREWADVLEYDPEVLVVAPCGFDLERTAANLDEVAGREGWDDLAAVREGRAYAMDGSGHVNRPGPRLVDTLEHLAGLIHPERFEAPPGDVARRIVGGAVAPE